jgi:hypothetical protein
VRGSDVETTRHFTLRGEDVSPSLLQTFNRYVVADKLQFVDLVDRNQKLSLESPR